MKSVCLHLRIDPLKDIFLFLHSKMISIGYFLYLGEIHSFIILLFSLPSFNIYIPAVNEWVSGCKHLRTFVNEGEINV